MINLLGIQFDPKMGDKTSNFQKIASILAQNEGFSPDLVLLSECFNSGYYPPSFQENAEYLGAGETSMFLSGMAERYNTYIAGSFIQKTPDNFKNTLVVFDRKGQIIGKYSKIHLFDYLDNFESNFVEAGDELVVIDLDFAKVGLSICYDLRFPVLYQKMAEKGATLFLNSACWGRARHLAWQTLGQARALENQAFFFGVNSKGYSYVANPQGAFIEGAVGDTIKAQIDFNEVFELKKTMNILDDKRSDIYG